MDHLQGARVRNYEIRDRIGGGGFGAVYRAYQGAIHREVAIKVILPERANNPEFVQRFETESRLIARMEHPYIVPLYDFWQDNWGAYLVMRLLPMSLRAALNNGPWDVAASARLLEQIAAALSVAHRAGIVHRDIKPDNILLDSDLNAYLTDFGIAKNLAAWDKTDAGLLLGSPVRLTPEQIRGEPVTPASDIYSLGLVIYEMLSGSKPFAEASSPAELLNKHLNEPLPALNVRRDKLPAALNEVLQMATAKNPGERYASAVRFAEAFRAAIPVYTPTSKQPLPEPLTDRELDILRLMVDGLSNKEVAASLFLTLGTVRWYVQQIYAKLDAHSREQAVDRARQLNLFGTLLATVLDKNMSIAKVAQPIAAPAPPKILTTEQRNRARMLDKVRSFWIEGVLENSLHGVALIALGMKEKPEAVERAWDIVLQQPEQADYTLPPGTSIGDVFDEMDGELLILGEPGSGKTMTLLELARDLLTEASVDDRQPMPTVFNLSSWAASHKPIHDWLVAELNSKYQIPRQLAQRWVEADQILPLLDGLDEVLPEHRAACVEAINFWRQDRGFVPIVVCSRITDYEALRVRLQLRSAIILQPLTLDQIDRSLSQASAELVPLRTAVQSDTALQSLLKTPLMLSVVTLTYRDMPDKALFTSGTPEARNKQLFNTYIAQMLRRRGTNQPYTHGQTVRWLSWLAQKLRDDGQSVFYIEQTHPAWLNRRRQRLQYVATVGLITGLALTIVVGFSFTTVMATMFSYTWDIPNTLRLEARDLLYGLVVGLAAAVVYVLPKVVVRLPFIFNRGKDTDRIQIKLTETLSWSWRRAAQGFLWGNLPALVPAILIYVIDYSLGFSSGQDDFIHNLSQFIAFMLLFGCPLGLIIAVIRGLRTATIQTKTQPNQGIRQTARNSITGALAVGLLAPLLFSAFAILLTFNPDVSSGSGLFILLMVLLNFGLAGFLIFGGTAIVEHLVLRLILARNEKMPWNYAHFLDYAADAILLRKVGGGYVYMHRMLLEHFAAMEPRSRKRKTAPLAAVPEHRPAASAIRFDGDGEMAGGLDRLEVDDTSAAGKDLSNTLTGSVDMTHR